MRYAVLVALGKIGPPARAAVPDLTRALRDEDTPLRAQAAVALGKIGPDAADAVPDLWDALRRWKDWLPRRMVVEALGAMGPTAVEPLREALNDTVLLVREAAQFALKAVSDSSAEPAAS